MAVVMAIRSSATAKLSVPASPSVASAPKAYSSKAQLKPNPVLLPTSTSFSLLALFNAPNEVKALTLDKDQIVSSLNEVTNRKLILLSIASRL